MSQKVNAAMPEDLTLSGSWTVEWDAVDPTTGASVSGIVISLANVVGDDQSAPVQVPEGPDTGLGPFMLVPGPDA